MYAAEKMIMCLQRGEWFDTGEGRRVKEKETGRGEKVCGEREEEVGGGKAMRSQWRKKLNE